MSLHEVRFAIGYYYNEFKASVIYALQNKGIL
jgi:hypothetical protein